MATRRQSGRQPQVSAFTGRKYGREVNRSRPREGHGMTDNKKQDATASRGSRRPWADHWLLEAFQRLGHPAAGRLSGVQADSAWEALEQAGDRKSTRLNSSH